MMPIDEIKDVPMREWSIENRIDEALVENELAKQQRELGDFSKSDRMSSAGKCVRDRWARLNNIPIDSYRISSSRGLKLMMLGNLYEQFVLDLLEMAKITVHSQQLEVGVAPFVGHIDGIIELDRVTGPSDSLLEIKSPGSKQMDRLYEHGYAKWNPSYLAQLQVYMHALGLEDAIVIVVSRDDANIYAERVLYDMGLALDLIDKSLLATSEAMPERPPEARGPSSKYCYWCQRVDWCYDPATGWDPER